MPGSDIQLVIGAKDLATKVLDSVDGRLGAFQSSVLKASVVMTGAWAGFQAIRNMGQSFLQQIEVVDRLASSSVKLGTTVNELEAYRLALETIGNIQPGEADAMLTKLARNIGEASLKGGAAAEAFKTLKIDIDALTKSSTTSAFKTVTEALRGVQNQTQQLSLTTQIFGRGSADLLPVIRGTAAEYEIAAGAAERLGLALSDIEIAKIQEADAALEQMQRSIEGIQRAIAVELSGSITGLANGFTNANQEAGQLVKLIGLIGKGLGFLAATANDWNPLQGKFGLEGANKFLDALERAKDIAADIKPPATVGDVIKSEQIDKEEATRLKMVQRVADQEREADQRRMDALKKMNEDILRDIEREREQYQQSAKMKAREIAEEIDPTLKIKREIEEIQALIREGFLGADVGGKAIRKLQGGDLKASNQATQAFEARLLTRGGPGTNPVEKATKDVVAQQKKTNDLLQRYLNPVTAPTVRLEFIQ